MAVRYEIKNRLGTGGAGTVYRAWDTVLDRPVALKRLLVGLEVEVQVALESDLLREASLLSNVTHPNVCQVYDFGTDEEGSFVVMEFLNGETLDRTVQRGVSMEEFFGIATQVLEGLAAAHAKSVLHRDIKPGNIMVNWLAGGKFVAKILDFGLAKYSRAPELQKVDPDTNTVVGTVHFMAPEQFERQPLDVRTDIYSTGCVLYYLLTNGKLPFGEGWGIQQVIDAHLRGGTVPAHMLRPDAGVELSQWLAWLTNRNPNARPQSASEALRILQRIPRPGAMAPAPQFSAPQQPVPQRLPSGPVRVAGQPSTRITGPTPSLAGASHGAIVTGEHPRAESVPVSVRPAARPAKKPVPITTIVLWTVGALTAIGLVVAIVVANNARNAPKPAGPETISADSVAKGRKAVVPQPPPPPPPKTEPPKQQSPPSTANPPPAQVPGGPLVEESFSNYQLAEGTTFDHVSTKALGLRGEWRLKQTGTSPSIRFQARGLTFSGLKTKGGSMRLTVSSDVPKNEKGNGVAHAELACPEVKGDLFSAFLFQIHSRLEANIDNNVIGLLLKSRPPEPLDNGWFPCFLDARESDGPGISYSNGTLKKDDMTLSQEQLPLNTTLLSLARFTNVGSNGGGTAELWILTPVQFKTWYKPGVDGALPQRTQGGSPEQTLQTLKDEDKDCPKYEFSGNGNCFLSIIANTKSTNVTGTVDVTVDEMRWGTTLKSVLPPG